MRNFDPFLEDIYDNNNIDYELVLDENLKNVQDVLPLLLDRFESQKDKFEEYLPTTTDLGLLRIDFQDTKLNLKPNP